MIDSIHGTIMEVNALEMIQETIRINNELHETIKNWMT